MLVRRAKILTTTKRGQKLLAKYAALNSWIGLSTDIIPPNRMNPTIVTIVSRKPMILYWSCGPRFGVG